MRRDKKSAAPDAPQKTTPRRTWFQWMGDWYAAHRKKGAVTEHDTVKLTILGHSPSTLEGFRVVRSGFRCGAWGEVELDCVQFFREGDPGWISTEMLIERATSDGEFRGLSTALTLEGESQSLPHSWRKRRLYFLGHFLLDEAGREHILELAFVGGKWVHRVVSWKMNVWTRNDWFVRQRV